MRLLQVSGALCCFAAFLAVLQVGRVTAQGRGGGAGAGDDDDDDARVILNITQLNNLGFNASTHAIRIVIANTTQGNFTGPPLDAMGMPIGGTANLTEPIASKMAVLLATSVQSFCTDNASVCNVIDNMTLLAKQLPEENQVGFLAANYTYDSISGSLTVYGYYRLPTPAGSTKVMQDIRKDMTQNFLPSSVLVGALQKYYRQVCEGIINSTVSIISYETLSGSAISSACPKPTVLPTTVAPTTIVVPTSSSGASAATVSPVATTTAPTQVTSMGGTTQSARTDVTSPVVGMTGAQTTPAPVVIPSQTASGVTVVAVSSLTASGVPVVVPSQTTPGGMPTMRPTSMMPSRRPLSSQPPDAPTADLPLEIIAKFTLSGTSRDVFTEQLEELYATAESLVNNNCSAAGNRPPFIEFYPMDVQFGADLITFSLGYLRNANSSTINCSLVSTEATLGDQLRDLFDNPEVVSTLQALVNGTLAAIVSTRGPTGIAPTTPAEESDTGLSTGAIAGIAVGAVAGSALILLAAIVFVKFGSAPAKLKTSGSMMKVVPTEVEEGATGHEGVKQAWGDNSQVVVESLA
eukprot:scpid20685/ scgid30476/ 